MRIDRQPPANQQDQETHYGAKTSIVARLVDLICDRYIVGVEDPDELRGRFVRLYIANGAIGMLREWVDRGFPISGQEFAELIYVFSRKVIAQ